MATSPTQKQKTVLINLKEDKALLITDDGLTDASDYEAEWRLICEEGDRTAYDYVDSDMVEDCE